MKIFLKICVCSFENYTIIKLTYFKIYIMIVKWKYGGNIINNKHCYSKNKFEFSSFNKTKDDQFYRMMFTTFESSEGRKLSWTLKVIEENALKNIIKKMFEKNLWLQTKYWKSSKNYKRCQFEEYIFKEMFFFGFLFCFQKKLNFSSSSQLITSRPYRLLWNDFDFILWWNTFKCFIVKYFRHIYCILFVDVYLYIVNIYYAIKMKTKQKEWKKLLL